MLVSKDGSVMYKYLINEVGQKATYKDMNMPMYKCTLYIRGNIRFQWGDLVLFPTPYSMILMPRGIVHSVDSDDQVAFERHMIYFYLDVLPEALQARMRKALSRGVLYVDSLQDILPDMLLLRNCFAMPASMQREALSARLTAMLYYVMLRVDNEDEQDLSVGMTTRVLEFIHTNIANSSEFLIDSLSQRFLVSKSQLRKQFVKDTGVPLARYVRKKRYEYAEALRGEGIPAIEAASMAGFESYSTYYRMRKREMQDLNIIEDTLGALEEK